MLVYLLYIFPYKLSDAYRDVDKIYYGPATTEAEFYRLYLQLTDGDHNLLYKTFLDIYIPIIL